ncbi:autotransporter-associated beta strand repeat-containing protein [Luteolibacter ambystomatis]|uniref:Autotransporter-associated beta strand repeat-containing protein n=1 Tax=Luteolibacter ambystomatis TaxID=2824561 RepID=A0A975J2U3_9BACT|nr:autotransporter-associated beta strand repeat-containing protein [Luteolibacter ambystomatis]QUE52981.1 autotransporter-associated beta strand repeat-containing protein [Luteolibacter ambystomatis]
MKPRLILARIALPHRHVLPCLIVVASALAGAAQGADSAWILNNNGNWSTVGNWLGSTVADGAGSTATFNIDISADRTISLDTARTIGNLFFRDTTVGSNCYIIGGTNTLTLDNGANKPTISIYPRTGAIVARIDRPIAGTNGFQVLAPGGAASMGLGGVANTFSGVLTIGAGVSLRTDNGSSLGAKDALTTVTSGTGDPTVANYTEVLAGGTLSISNQNHGTEYIKAAGTGWDGNGAVVNLNATQTSSLQQMELTGDTTLGGSSRWDIRHATAASGRLFQNGFTITKTGANQISLVNVQVIGGGNVIVNQGIFGVEAGTVFDGAGTVTVNSGGSFNLYENTGVTTRAVLMNGGTMNHTSTAANATYGGNITLAAATTISQSGATGSLTLTGTIDGTGSLTKAGPGTLHLNGANTFTGATILSAGTLQLGTSPLASADLTITGGTLFDNLATGVPQGISGTLTAGRTGTAATDITGSVTLASGANLEIGPSARNAGGAVECTVGIGKSLQLNGGGKTYFDLGSSGADLSDKINIGENLVLNGVTDVHVSVVDGELAAGSYILASYAGALTGSEANLSLSGLPADTRQSFALSTATIANAVTLDVTGNGANLVWSGGLAGNAWDLHNTANFSNDGAADGFYNLDRVFFNDSGIGGAPILLSGTLMPGKLNVNATQEYTFSGTGIISGRTSLTKQGGGWLHITGTAHDYSGGVIINSGGISVPALGNNGSPSPLGIAGTIVLQGGILSFTGTSESSNKVIDLGTTGGNLDVPAAGSSLTLTAANPLLGTGVLTVSGAGSIRLVRDNAPFTLGTSLAGNGHLRLNPRTVAGATTSLEVSLTGTNSGFSGGLTLESPASGSWRLSAASGTAAKLGSSAVTVGAGAQLYASGVTLTNPLTLTGNGYVENGGTTGGALRLDTSTINGTTLTIAGAAKIGCLSSGNGIISSSVLRGATAGTNDDILTIGGSNQTSTGVIVFTGTVEDTSLDKIIVGGGGTSTSPQVLQVGSGTASGSLGNIPVQLGSDAQPVQLRFHQADDYIAPSSITSVGTSTELHANTQAGTTNGKGLVFTGTVAAGYLGVGTSAAASSSISKLTIESGANVAAGNFYVGDAASRSGVVAQTGGSIAVSSGCRIGHFATESSIYTMSGGTLTLTGNPTANPSTSGVAEQVGGIYVGIDGVGALEQSGGTISTRFVVLDNRGDTAGTDTLTLNGGSLVLTSIWGLVQRNASTVVNLGGGTIVAGANLPIDATPVLAAATTSMVNTGGFTVTAPKAFSGSGNLAITGGGTFSATATSTATGALTVSGSGTTFSGTGTAPGATAVIHAGAKVRSTGTMGFPGTLTLDAGSTLEASITSGTAATKVVSTGQMTVNGTVKVSLSGYTPVEGDAFNLADFASFSGTPSFDFTGAALTGGLTWSTANFATDGTVRVVSGNAYTAFESANGIFGAGATADSDGDGLANGIEFVLGGDPSGPGSDSSALRPLVTMDENYLHFVFRRADVSIPFNPRAQYGSDLTSWTDAVNGSPNGTPVFVLEEDDAYGPGIDRVSVSIPRALVSSEKKLFVRLKVELP